MNLLSVERLSKQYADKSLFSQISFGIDKGEKVALIARNGTGKTSLMKIIAGLEAPDEGSVTLRKDILLAFLEQEPFLDPSKTVLENVFHSDNPRVRLIREYESVLEEDLAHSTAITRRRLEELGLQLDATNSWDFESRVRQVLSSLNVHHLDKPVRQLSGGQRKRLALARVLLEPSDLLLLDEPTNHLDVDMVEWLESELVRSTLTLLMVTHDRYFLDSVCTRIIELDEGKLYSYEGNYSYFLEKKAERELQEEREQDKSRNILRTELEWMRRMPRARGTKSKARIDAFHELKEKATGSRREERLQLDVKMNRIGGKVLEMKKVYKSFGDLPILRGFDYTFKTGERTGIVGPNGVGKSTFLNMITGREVPDSGKINVGDTIVFGYFSQESLDLKVDKRVIEVVREFADVIQLSDGTKVQASQFLQHFGFSPEMQHTFISKLSGGEKRRLQLLIVLIKNPNFLILDEPTNDLDLLTLGILEEFLLNYRGCLLLVSHDRYFMDKLTDHLFVFEGDGNIRDFNGSYTEYRMLREESEKRNQSEAKKRKSVERKENMAEVPVKRKLTYRERLEFDTLENEIYLLEAEKSGLTDKMSSGVGSHEELMAWSQRMLEIIRLLDEKSLRWLELSEHT